MLKPLLLSAITAVALLASHAHSKVYTWVDSDGTTHFSDLPIADAEEVDVQVTSSGGSMNQGQSNNQSQNRQMNNSQNRSGQNNQGMPPSGNMQGPGMMNMPGQQNTKP